MLRLNAADRISAIIRGLRDSIIYELKCRPVLGLALVIVAVALMLPQATPPSYLQDGQWITLTGTVKNKLYRGYGGEDILQISITGVTINTQELKTAEYSHNKTGRLTRAFQYISVNLPADSRVYMGQTIQVSGEVSLYSHATNPGQFDYADYNLNRGNLFLMRNGQIKMTGKNMNQLEEYLYQLRLKGEGILACYLEEDDAAIMKAMLFGNKTEIDSEVKELFQKNGIAHILAISGLHISFIGMGIYKLLRRTGLPNLPCVFLSETLIILYGIMVGMQASAVRAICMFTLYLISKLLLRTYDMLTGISAAAIILLLINHGYIRDTGFQLSFMAVLGVGFFAAGFSRNVIELPPWAGSITVSIGVFLSTLPVLLSSYYQVAFYSVLLNLVIIPLMSVLLVAAIIVVLLGGLGLELGSPLPLELLCRAGAWVVRLILYLYKQTCSFLEGLGMGRHNLGAPKTWQIILFYTLLICACYPPDKLIKRIIDRTSALRLPIKALCSCLLMCLAVLLLTIHPHSGLNIYMLDVGQGDCMVLQNDNGHTYIIDGGSTSVQKVGDYRIIPFLQQLGVENIEGVILTHPDADHINGIEELLTADVEEQLHVEQLILYEGFVNNGDFADMIEQARTNGTQVVALKRGDTISDRRLSLSVIYPYGGASITDANNGSIVMNVGYGDFHMLTTGDLEQEGEQWIVEHEKRTDYAVLKVGHHGSSSSSSEEFIEWAEPEIGIISVGENNSYGHPHRETLETLKANGVRILRTDEIGCIHLTVSRRGRIWAG